jgi:ornithine carbamoyltransferase
MTAFLLRFAAGNDPRGEVKLSAQSFLSTHDLTAGQTRGLFELTSRVKSDPGAFSTALAGKSLAMIFQKSSTRTRVSFEVGVFEMGGHALFLSSNDIQLGRGETIADTAQVLSRYTDGIMARTYAHEDVRELARHGSVPVINGLTDLLHPCQAMADYFTLQEIFGDLRGRKLAYIGDGNNVAHSLLLAASKVGMDIAVATPPGFEPDAAVLDLAQQDARAAGIKIEVDHDPAAAAVDASAVYTDVWASMGQEDEAERRLHLFRDFIVDDELMSKALPEAAFLHCLPCHRDEEVSAEVADGEQSRIFDQAENRLHTQKAIMLWLMGGFEI